MNDLAKKKRLYPVWFLAAALAFAGGAAAFFRTYLDWKHLPLVILSSLLLTSAFAFGLLLAADAGEKEHSGRARLLIFLIGDAAAQAALWTVLTLVNTGGQYNRRAIYTAYFIFMPLFLLFALVVLRRIPKLGIRLVNRLLALLCVAGMAVAAAAPIARDPDAFLIKCLSPGQPAFESLPAESMAVSEEERESCEKWFREHILLDAEKPVPAFSADIDGVDLRDTVSFFEISRSDPVDRGEGETTVVTLSKTGLEIRAVGTIYKDYATCEWTVYIRNTGDAPSAPLSEVLAMDGELSVRSPSVYYSTGSQCRADDFTMKKAFLVPTVPLRFRPEGGRSSDGYLPFFNVSGRGSGVVAAVGWTGEWQCDAEKTDEGVSLAVGQREFSAALLPGEEIRTPRVSLTFYHSSYPVKGFNLFRDFVRDCLEPDNMTNLTSFVLADEFSTLTADELVEKAEAVPSEKLAYFNNFWMDAGWYDYTDSWADGVGTWTANTQKFPATLRQVGDAAAAMGKRYLLWYEPERVREGTYLYEEGEKHAGWLIGLEDEDNYLWNLADDDAADFLAGYISASLKENGVTVYRQDFNMEPLDYWRKADAELYGGRTGMAENRYVTNLYRYLDTLLRDNPGLLIDNCASGGRRIDLEMMARSVPLWRSDYNCDASRPDILEATQAMTYGLSFWLPRYGTSCYAQDDYAARSSVMPCCSTGDGSSDFIGAYEDLRDDMLRDYFPMTKGGPKNNTALAMQYGGAEDGHAVIYLREKLKDETVTLCFSGLYSDRLYTVTNRDDPTDVREISGSQLMKTGMVVPVIEKRAALIYEYALR